VPFCIGWSTMDMDGNQIELYHRSGELARRYHEYRRQRAAQAGPDRPWFFHPLGYFIDIGFSGRIPEYDKPQTRVSKRTATFAQRMGMLSRTTKIWEDKEALVLYLQTELRAGYCQGVFTAGPGFRITAVDGPRYEGCC
jgi:hypothetical protein